ncbi:MAG: metal-dependent transcriptional regulator, partial [Armatimonadota bacterium]|nr:metal-dependent transcriptional regulator [Armatimonadota bacterium]
IRHHRLLELYLSRALGVSLDRVHGEADRLEHVISEDLEERIAASLGQPDLDPHGDPIPARDGSVAARTLRPLTAATLGQRGVIARVSDRDDRVVRHLAAAGLLPGVALEVTSTGRHVEVRLEGAPQPRRLTAGLARAIEIVVEEPGAA